MLGLMETHFIISSMTVLVRQRGTRSYAADWHAGQHENHGSSSTRRQVADVSQGPPVEARTMPS